MQSVNTKFENENMLVNGTVIACVLACAGTGEAVYFEKPIDFEYKYPLKAPSSALHCTPEIDISS